MSLDNNNHDNINNESSIDEAVIAPIEESTVRSDGEDFDDLSVIDISSDVEYQLNQERTGMEVVKLEPNKSTRKLNAFDLFFVRVWAAIVSAITVVSSAISKGFFKLFKKELPTRYVNAFIGLLLIILLLIIVLSPFHLTMDNSGSVEIFGNSMMPVAKTDASGALKWGYVNKSGREVIPCQFVNAEPFYHNVAFVQTDATTWRLIGTNGVFKGDLKVKTDSADPDKRVIGDFNNAEKRAWIIENGRYVFIKPNGDKAFGNITYEYAESYRYGYALVKMDRIWYFIDGKGKKHGDKHGDNYTDAKSFSEGLAAVRKSSGWTFVDTNFNEMESINGYTAVTSFHDGYAWVRRGDAVNLIDKSGKFVLPADYNGLKPSDNDLRELGLLL